MFTRNKKFNDKITYYARCYLIDYIKKMKKFTVAYRYHDIWFPENFDASQIRILTYLSEFDGFKLCDPVVIQDDHNYFGHKIAFPVTFIRPNDACYIAGFIPVPGKFTHSKDDSKNSKFEDILCVLSNINFGDCRVQYLKSSDHSVLLFPLSALLPAK